MKTQRELLELAAKAAGIRVEWVPEHECVWIALGQGLECRPWLPLTDDGDALRLAVKLRINIEHAETLSRKPHGVNCWPVGRGDCAWMELDIDDYAAATRLAITRAAAAIGEGMAQSAGSTELTEDNYYKSKAEAEEAGRAAAIGEAMP